jgi:integral membrane protein (TIGR01906 family)
MTAKYMRTGSGESDVVKHFSQDEISGYDSIDHLLDVRAVYVMFWRLGIVCTAIITGVLLLVWKQGLWRWLRRSLRIAVTACIAIPVALGLTTALAFDFLFTIFHEIIFPQGNWQFLHSSLIIQTFPEQFWFICMSLILIFVSCVGIILYVLSALLNRRCETLDPDS